MTAEESAVKVCVRVRPLIAREKSAASENAEPVQLFWKADKKSIHPMDDGNSSKSFSFDRVFTAEETTKQLYQEIAKPLVVSSVEGYNGTIFAYGQTSSGKTFTMMGSDRVPGVIPLAVEDVFHTIKNCPNKEFLLRVSYMEIYNETVTDLLVDSRKRKPLEVRETINKNIYVADLTEELVTSPAQALAWIQEGEKNRHYGKTKMNQRSSRSHVIFRMILESRERSDTASGDNADSAIIVSHLNLVDLAGSERASQSGAEGTRLKEGCHINLSLFTLGQVIKKLTDESQKGFTNYRDSKLTRILQNSLGGNAKTVIICTVTPVALDETLSTLQFASTAKKMKNDPHVTEVSDDGALLKRYRNEIVDLKRRLHEVSSVTQTTATEKEFLSQLLLEKDQLQRDQQDRIKNLTKLLVTSSNLVSAHKPNRRVTWAGDMLKLVRPAAFGCNSTDLSLLGPFSLKKSEEYEDFDTHWEIPEESPDDMETSRSPVTVGSFQDSPKDSLIEERMHEMSCKVSALELQLQTEVQRKDEALGKTQRAEQRAAELELQLQTEVQRKDEALGETQRAAELELQLQMEVQQKDEALGKTQRAAELELQLQTEVQRKDEALGKTQRAEQRAAELELQLQTEVQRKDEALGKTQRAEQRAAELELQLQTEVQQKDEALGKTQRAAELELQLQTEVQRKDEALGKTQRAEQRAAELELQLQTEMRREFAEAVQLCESLSSEKEMAIAERDHLKRELEAFMARVGVLEKDNASLSRELSEKRDLDEFESLEEELRKEHQDDLQNEMSSLKKSTESSELQCLELLNKIETLSGELKRKSDFAEELQSMSGKDLVQEVAKLRRSLYDAEGLSRDTKKEWAVLRSQNIALEEKVVNLTAGHERMDAEVNSLRLQLEAAKARYRNMQNDLQKELNVVFDENAKLTALLDGKVPKNLADSVELERAVANLKKELAASREAEAVLGAQLDELASSRPLPETVDSLAKQAAELTEELCAVRTQRDGLLSASGQYQEEARRLRGSLQTSQDEVLTIRAELSAAESREKQLRQECAGVSQQTDSFLARPGSPCDEKSRLTATGENAHRTRDGGEQRASLEEKLADMQQLMRDLEEKLADSESSRVLEEEIGKELQEQLNQMTEELRRLRAEGEQSAAAQRSAEEMDNLLSALTSLTAERDRLGLDLQENVQMAAERLALLQSLQGDLRELRQQNSDLATAFEQKESDNLSLSQRLQRVQDEKETLLTSGVQSSAEETERLRSAVASLTAERDQLQMDLRENVDLMIEHQEQLRTAMQESREQRDLIKRLQAAQASQHDGPPGELSAQIEELQAHTKALTEDLERVRAERDLLLAERTADSRTRGEETETLLCRVASLGEERDRLREALEALRQEKEDRMETLQNEVQTLVEELRCVEAERNSLLSEKEASRQTSAEATERLLCRVASLGEERDRLREALRQEKEQLGAELEDRMESAAEAQSRLHSLQQQLQEHRERDGERERLWQEARAQLEQQVAETRSLLVSLREELREQKQKNLHHMELCEQKESDLQRQANTLTERLESARAERDALLSEREAGRQAAAEETERLLCRASSLGEERDRLREALEALRQEKERLGAELEDRMEKLSTTREKLSEQRSTMQQQAESREREAKQQQRLLGDANATISALREQLSALSGSSGGGSGVEGAASSQLQDSTAQLQEVLGEFQYIIDTCSQNNSSAMDKAICPEYLFDTNSVPEPTLKTHDTVCDLRRETLMCLGNIYDHLQVQAQNYMDLLEEMVEKDLAVFEERRLQDVLLCRAQAPKYSVGDEDFAALWEQRLPELLDKRRLYLQKMRSICKKLYADMNYLPGELTADVRERFRFMEQTEAAFAAEPVNFAEVDGLLSRELEHRSAMMQSRKTTLRANIDSHRGLCEEIEALKAQADSRLGEERSKSRTLLRALEGAPLKTELSLLQDNRQLVLKLQQAEEQVRALCVQIEQLEDSNVRANDAVSNHKRATQLLQTELQDSRAEVEERENTIRTLGTKLRESAENTSPSAVELEKLQTKLFQMELELSSASDQHQQEIQRMTSLLGEKEDSLRRLKVTLRRSQQQGEESFLKGEDLYARLTNPRGLTAKSAIELQKSKLEVEVQQLRLKVTELESLASGQQAELSKWKNRAVKLKYKSKAEADRPLPPRTPTKRGPPSDSSDFLCSPKKFPVTPRKVLEPPKENLDSPTLSRLESPKSRIFGVDGSSEVLSRVCPQQFFDNSSLGIAPDGVESQPKTEYIWPRSPTEEEMCRTQ